jgi:hypothetical protein
MRVEAEQADDPRSQACGFSFALHFAGLSNHAGYGSDRCNEYQDARKKRKHDLYAASREAGASDGLPRPS